MKKSKLVHSGCPRRDMQVPIKILDRSLFVICWQCWEERV